MEKPLDEPAFLEEIRAMSYFESDRILADTHVLEARAEGVQLERRSLLRVSASTVAAALAFGSCRSADGAPAPAPAPAPEPALAPVDTPAPTLSDGTIEVAEFLTEMYPRAQRVIASGGTHEEAYLMSVSELMARLHVPANHEIQAAMREFRAGHEGGAVEIMVLAFSFEAGQGFSHHDHRDYNGVIMGVAGEVRCRNYDILGDDLVPPQGETFQIRKTRDDLILPGSFSTLARTRDNVHEVVAGPEGGRVLDVFTYFERGARSYFLDVDPTARDEERGIFDAAWS